MKENFLNILIIIFTAFGIYYLSYYSNNKKLNYYDKFIFQGNKFMKNEIIYDLIKYNVDSSGFYSTDEINLFVLKIKNLEKYDLIDKIYVSYNIPNEINIKIKEKTPIYIVKNDIYDFAIDNKGLIFDSNFIDESIPNINLDFFVYEIYKDMNENSSVSDLMSNINYNNQNNQYLLNALDILGWFNREYKKTDLKSINIQEHFIDVNLVDTKLTFVHDNLDRQLQKLFIILNDQSLLDSLKVNEISDLSEVKLSFNNQIIIKK